MNKPTDSLPLSMRSAGITAERSRRQGVQAIGTGMAVLKGLARLGGMASLTGLASHIGENPAKVHRYLVSLIEEGMVAQDPRSQQYRLGLEALLVGVAAMRQADPVRVAESSLIRLRDTLDVTCFVAVMGNKGPTIVRFEEPGLPVTVNVRVGSVLSMLWSATGRVFLGLLGDARVRAMAEEELGLLSPDARGQLDLCDPIGKLRDEVTAGGCSAVVDTNLKGISAVAAPVYDYAGHLCAVLTALGATGGFDASLQGPIAQAVRQEAHVMSAQLGYMGSGGGPEKS